MEKKSFSNQSLDQNRSVNDIEEGATVAHGQLAKHFSLWSTLGIQFSITATPLAIGTYLSVAVGVGGSPVFFFGYLLAVGMNLCVCLSLAEISAVYPNASGQIYWAAVLAKKTHARSLSYITGWLGCAGWFFWTAAAFLITSQLIWALVQVCHASFVTQPWHFYIVYLAIGLIALLFNIPFFQQFVHMTKGLVGLINAGALFVLIVLLVRTSPKQSASYVFTDFVNETGWTSKGVVFFLGLLPGLTAVNGFDCAAHMADEMPNPARQVPQVMVGSAVLSAISGIPMILVYSFCTVNPANLLIPIGGQPIAQLMVDSFRSLPLSAIGIVIFIIVLAAASISLLTTFSRIWWAFSREGGVPFSNTMARVDGRTHLPVNSILCCFGFCVIVGAIELGSTTALNAILGCGLICILLSYAIPISCLLMRSRSYLPTKRYFNLGFTGVVLNYITVFWTLFMTVWLCFPLYLPVTGNTMNYAVVVLAIVFLVTGLNWVFNSRKIFRIPGDEPLPLVIEPQALQIVSVNVNAEETLLAV